MSFAGPEGRAAEGFTLIELLIVIAIIGILAAIAIPNLLNAVQRGKQKRTMSDMRALATAVETYAVDHGTYPTASCPAGTFTTSGPRLTTDSFTSLAPTYVAVVPALDGWGRFYQYAVRADSGAYNLRSTGRDGANDSVTCGTTTDFNSDIVYSNGSFVQWPEGTQN